MHRIKRLSFSSVLLILAAFALIIIYSRHILTGIWLPPDGDNLTLHIALAKSMLNGSILHPNYKNIVFYPAINEVVLALFLLLKIPVNLFNILGVVILFLVSYFTGRVFEFKKNYAAFFAVAIISIYDVLRWSLSQTIDIWLLSYFLLTLALLYKPKANNFFYLMLGFSAGMLLGSRFTAPATILTLFIFFLPNFRKYLNLKRLFLFLIPVCVLGVSWYLRNYLVTGDPFYPQTVFIFKGECETVCSFLSWNVLKSLTIHPQFLISAFISEYMIYSLLFIFLPIFYLLKRKNKKFSTINKLILLGIINLIIYLFFPSYKYYDSIVAGVRYSLPVFGVFLLALFLIFKQYKKEEILEIIVFANISFLLLPFSYHPKLLLIYIPFLSGIIYFVRRFYLDHVTR